MLTCRNRTTWEVSVNRDGENIVTIGSSHLSGMDIGPDEARLIRDAAQCLISFAGAEKPPAGPAAPSEPLLCQAEEWQRDGRGLWAMRACISWGAHEQHTFERWRYHVDPPVAAALRESEARCRQLQDENTRLAGLLGGNGPSDSGDGAPRRGSGEIHTCPVCGPECSC